MTDLPDLRPAPTGRPLTIGLTGPIGCGKSTVARMLGEMGGLVIDADALARDVTAPGQPALAAIRGRFGDGVFKPSGSLDRASLAAVAFEDAAALRDLEAIVHPPVRQLVEASLARGVAEHVPFCVVEAIKLVETGLADRCDEVWLIDCDGAAQRTRLRGRGMTDDDIERRLSAQGEDLAARLAPRATHRIDTTQGAPESIRERVGDALADALEPVFGGLPLGDVQRRA